MRPRRTNVPPACTSGPQRQGSATWVGTSARRHSSGRLPRRTGGAPNAPSRFSPGLNGQGVLLSPMSQAMAHRTQVRPDDRGAGQVFAGLRSPRRRQGCSIVYLAMTRRYCAEGNRSGLEPARSGLQGMEGSCWVVTSRPAEITEQYATTCGSPKFTLQRITGCPR
jgi:hypothetical protein